MVESWPSWGGDGGGRRSRGNCGASATRVVPFRVVATIKHKQIVSFKRALFYLIVDEKMQTNCEVLCRTCTVLNRVLSYILIAEKCENSIVAHLAANRNKDRVPKKCDRCK